MLLNEPQIPPSIAWKLAVKEFGEEILNWEPDTIRLELQRKGITNLDQLMAKLLGAQTILLSNAWTYDHDVFFAFCLACTGLSSASDAIHYPEPREMCWGVREIEHLLNKEITDDEGFDWDGVDPAIAATLYHENFILAPTPLEFCQEVLNKLFPNDFSSEIQTEWKKLDKLTDDELHARLDNRDDDILSIQLKKLADCRMYINEQESTRLKYYGIIND